MLFKASLLLITSYFLLPYPCLLMNLSMRRRASSI